MSTPHEPARKGLTYKEAGVDVVAKDAAAKGIVDILSFARTGIGAPLGGKGHFAGMVEFGEHALVLCTDGVGTKLEVANALKKWDTVGIDCIAMNVNDAVCVGAEPIAFVDYLAVDKADPHLARELAKGLNEGARQSNISIVGGETAILPEIVKGFDLAGTCLAFVKKSDIISGDGIAAGDVIVGVASAGIHSNGLTLARRILAQAGIGYDRALAGSTVGDHLLTPTRIYVRAVMDLLRTVRPHGISHVTGSGLLNLPRLNRGFRYVITDPLPVPPIFELLAREGRVDATEMHRTFNMGMGLAVIVAPGDAQRCVEALSRHFQAKVVGEVLEGATGIEVPSRGVVLEGAKF